MNYLYILVAPSAVGKSSLLNEFRTKKNSATNDYYWYAINKYSTRDCRNANQKSRDRDDVINIDDKSDELIAAKNEYIKKKDEADINKQDAEIQLNFKLAEEKLQIERSHYIEKLCNSKGKVKNGIIYYMNRNIYAFNYREIEEGLKLHNCVIICSDFDTIKELKENPIFGNQVQVIYIASSMDENTLLERYKDRMKSGEKVFNITNEGLAKIEEYNEIMLSAGRLKYYEIIEANIPKLNNTWNSMLEYYKTICARKENIRKLFSLYIENIAYVDHVILNFYNLDYMYEQMRKIIENNNENDVNDKKIKTPLFMVCAAPSSGKGTLMEIVGNIGKINDTIIQVEKYAQRKPNPLTDHRDNMKPIGNEKFENYIKDKKNIWEWEGHKKNIKAIKKYAVDIEKINENIKNGNSQIFIANFEQIKKAKELFPNNIVILYLHATHESETLKHIENKRLTSIKENSVEKAKITDEQIKISKEFIEAVNSDLTEIKDTHMDYKKYISEVDHVLLNTGTEDDLINQMLKILKVYK